MGADESVKISSKGLNKAAIEKKGDPYKMFTSVLETGVSQGATNVGFKIHRDKIYTYNCYRNALPFFYIKRKCFTPCSIFTTTYRDLVLNPVPKHYFCLYSDAFGLTLDDQRELQVDQVTVSTLRQAHCYLKLKASLDTPEQASKTGRKKSSQKMKQQTPQQMLTAILNTTDARQLDRLEKSIEVHEDFYTQEFDMMYQLVGLKINSYPNMLEELSKAGNSYIANTCPYNRRLGVGLSAKEVRFRAGAHLQGGNLLGKLWQTYALMTRSTLNA